MKFYLGELPLAQIWFTVDVYLMGLQELLTEDSDRLRVPSPKNGDGILLRSFPISRSAKRVRLQKSRIYYISQTYRRYYTDLSIGYTKYLENFSAKSRATVRRKVRRFQEHCHGQVFFRRFSRVDEMKEFYDLARRVSESSYQEKLLDVGLPNDETFYLKMVQDSRSDRVRAYLLLHEERPVAYLYCDSIDGVLLYSYLGYDPEYREWSIGTILQWLVMEDLLQTDTVFKYFDFDEGEGSHKEFFSTGSVYCGNIFVLKLKLKSVVVVLLHIIWERILGGIKAMLDAAGLKSKIKNLARFGR
jgi:arginyl-tRNA--protein-N-Asp/Glu arginylyltransferase